MFLNIKRNKLTHAPLWHFDTSVTYPQWFHSQICCNTPMFCIAAIFVKYSCYRRPSDTIWQHRPWSTLTQVIVCCWLKAPGHYLNQCWLLSSEILWHSPESNFTMSAPASIRCNKLKNYSFKIIPTSPRGQWVNSSPPSAAYMLQWIRSALVQIMACHLFSTKPYNLNQYWVIVNWTLRNKLQWNFNQNTKFFIHKNASGNVCKMAAVLSRGRRVKSFQQWILNCTNGQ